MKPLKTAALVLGLLAGGAALGQAFTPLFVDSLRGKPLADSAATADDLTFTYIQKVQDAKSAAQVSQVAAEAQVRFGYLQARQNAEIIKLLTAIRDKK